MEFTKKAPQYIGANLCSKCSVLQFNDSNFGVQGYKGAPSESTDEYLSIRTESDSSSPKKVKLNYTHEDHLPELCGLLQSAEAGCDFCHLLRGSIQEHIVKLTTNHKIQIHLFYVWSGGDENILVELIACVQFRLEPDHAEGVQDWVNCTAVQDRTHWYEFIVQFEILAGQGNYPSWLRLQPTLPDDPLCEKNLQGLQASLKECCKVCKHSRGNGDLPARLLDLEANNTKYEIRLIKTQGMDPSQTLNYTALSYCWGSKADSMGQSITTANNIEERLLKIPFDSLSRVIQDAVIATRRLGLRYLWVDALCIIQGDEKDWAKESENMGLVYTNAFITIAALASASCHQGFLRRPKPLPILFHSLGSRDPSKRNSIVKAMSAMSKLLSIWSKPRVQGTYLLRHLGPRPGYLGRGYRYGWKVPTIDDYEHDLARSNWSRRGWTLQEEQLSTRVLFFGATRLQFRCVSRSWIEPFKVQKTIKLSDLILDVTPKKQIPESFQVHIIHKVWSSIVRSVYLPRGLTNTNDTFPAISGLARRVAKATGDEYIAGLWRSDLADGLLWMIDRPTKRGLEGHRFDLAGHQGYFCPSWSWAAAKLHSDTQLQGIFLDSNSHQHCEIISAWSILESKLNPFGRITHAELQIRSRVFDLPQDLYYFGEGNAHHRVYFEKENFGRFDVWLDFYRNSSEPSEQCFLCLVISSRIEDSPDTQSDEFSADSDDAVDANSEMLDGNLNNKASLVGLLVYPAQQEGKYHRVGSWKGTIPKGKVGIEDGLRDFEYRELHLI
ncbi:heterokaryon incompatibility protein-domain-containing protein [Dendryphion nanum]|uniref:Heterokaryon incompatibility protein-domain-containing protein n=1 Tax=Dendryphion nanum TaxID=256645 RepID=A0A9P9J2Y6_9PLEO|nr:heterokaryon incompatibility protein-domain-containing protein [Dendryphion nanum]